MAESNEELRRMVQSKPPSPCDDQEVRDAWEGAIGANSVHGHLEAATNLFRIALEKARRKCPDALIKQSEEKSAAVPPDRPETPHNQASEAPHAVGQRRRIFRKLGRG